MALCTLDQVKSRLTITDSGHDDLLTEIIAGVSGQLAGAAGSQRPLEKATRTDDFDILAPGRQTIYLPLWPVVSITSAKEAMNKGFDDVDALVEDTDFMVSVARGQLIRIGYWLYGRQTVRVVYEAGYTTPDVYLAEEYEQGTGEVLMPDEIVEAAIKQAAFVFQRRGELGLSGMSGPGGSISHYTTDKLLPEVEAVMRGYRRLTV